MTAYELPFNTELVIGKRRWKLIDRQKQHPDQMLFTETTGGEAFLLTRIMYPSEVQALMDAGFSVALPATAKERSRA